MALMARDLPWMGLRGSRSGFCVQRTLLCPVEKTVYLETFGCQMNELDSELVAGQLRALGYRFTNERDVADVVLYNTCSVREHAEQKVWSRLGN